MHELYGAAGPVHLLGIPHEQLAGYAAAPATPAPSDPSRFVVSGHVESLSRSSYEWGLCWRFHDGVALVEEIAPLTFHAWPFLPTGSVARLLRGLPAPPEPGPALDPVARAMWDRALPDVGLAPVLRMLTAWGRIVDAEQLRSQYGRTLVAAALDRLVCYRCDPRAGGYTVVASRYDVQESDVRAVNAAVQRRLKLSKTCVW